MKKQLAFRWSVAVFLTAFFLSSALRAQMVIQLEEDTPTPAVPTATPLATPIPVLPTPTASPQPSEPVKPAPVPEKPKVEKAGHPAVPVETSVPQARDGTSDENPILPLGMLEHPTLFLVFDGIYAKGLSGDTNSQGGGGLRMEIQWFSWISLGVYYDVTVYSNPGTTSFIGPLGLMGRLFPPDTGRVTPFAFGGLGLNSAVGANASRYPGGFHGFAGLGLECSFTDHWGLDLGCTYNYYSPRLNPLQSISLRAGLSYAIGL